MEQRSQELDWDMHMLCMHFHSLPSARVVSVGPVCDPQNQVGVIGLTGRIQKDKARRVDTADTVCVQEYHVHLNVDGLRVLPADFLSTRLHHFQWCIHGLCAGNPSDLNKWLPCSSQTACIPPAIAHVHPPSDVHWTIRGLTQLRALLPTSCVQGADIMMIIDWNKEANLWRRLFGNNAQKNTSLTIMTERLANS